MQNHERPCIICGKPRDGTRIWCGSDECYAKVQLIPDKVAAVRGREAIEALKQAPPDKIFVHIYERD